MGFDPRDSYPDRDRGPAPSGGGFSKRLLIAAIIALVGLFLYWNQSQVNPITGEKQHVAISPTDEVKLGLESAPEMAREMGGEVAESDPRTREVKQMGAKLVTNTTASKGPWEFNFHLLADDKTVNAFALPGGQVFITLGLLNKLQNEAQLAGVMGHEVGHVLERHSAQQMAKGQLGKILIVAVGAAASDSSQSGASQSIVIASMVNQMIQLRYGRKDEMQADTWGLKLMEEIGYDPYQMVTVMKILKEAGGGGGNMPSIFQTHPNPDLRIKLINEYLKLNPPKAGLTDGRPLHDGVPE